MEGVRSVRRKDGALEWTAEVCGKPVRWSAEISEAKPNRYIAWESKGGHFNSGTVTFTPVGPNATRIDLEIECDPRDMASIIEDQLGPSNAQLEEDLECFKELLSRAKPESSTH
jgi:uncharacterized membrane protein